jgi:hypothetical protein
MFFNEIECKMIINQKITTEARKPEIGRVFCASGVEILSVPSGFRGNLFQFRLCRIMEEAL